MQVREVYISNKHIGYLFYFKKVEDLNKTNNDSSLKSLFKLKTKANIKYLSLNYFNFKENAENDESNFNSKISRNSSLRIKSNNYNSKGIKKFNINFDYQKIIIKRSKSGKEKDEKVDNS